MTETDRTLRILNDIEYFIAKNDVRRAEQQAQVGYFRDEQTQDYYDKTNTNLNNIKDYFLDKLRGLILDSEMVENRKKAEQIRKRNLIKK